MLFETIEKLKQDFTDKYVVVDASRPELRRFEGMTGQVKTVNMNGRALVQFDGHANIGWYDIGLDFLKVVDKPVEKKEAAEKPKPAAKAAEAKAPAAPAKPAAKGGGMSMADILAAARGGAAPAAKPAAETPAKPAAVAKPAAKPADGGKPAAGMSVADILAAARGNAPAAPAAKAAPAPAAPPAPAAEEPAAEEPAAPAPPAAKPAASAPKGALPTDVAGILAYCRKQG